MAELARQLSWKVLPPETRELLTGKLAGLWGASTDSAVFDSLTEDKQQALLLLAHRMEVKGLWRMVKQVTNVYGEGGVGLQFVAWPMVESTLSRRRDFTKRFANHRDTTGGFYERKRGDAILHFLYQEGQPRSWYVHFDLYSPVHSPRSALKHLRHEFLGKVRPDWRSISQCLHPQSVRNKQ